jgi:hypothetical protein
MIKILLGIPSMGTIRVETMVSIISIMNQNSNIEFGMACPMGPYLHMSREVILEQGVTGGFDYVLFIDTDMTFPIDALNVLLSRDKDIIGVNYRYKEEEPSRYTTQIFSDIPDSLIEPFKAKGLATGFLLIKVSILQNIKKPWFFYEYRPSDTNPWMGEDFWFCNQAMKAGFDLWCDPTVKMGHIGMKVY